MPAHPFPVLMFAAGFGTRMGDLTKDRPKPLITVAGKPLVDHTLDLARGAGCAPVVANLHYRADMLAAHLMPKDVQTVVEHPDILETGGGLRNALPLLGAEPVVTMNTDAVWAGPNPVSLLMEAWDPETMDALLMCLPTARAQEHRGLGDFTLSESGALSRGPGHVYGGVQILKTDLLADVRETAFSLNIIWNKMQSAGRLHGLSYPGWWCDVGHPGGIASAEQMLKEHHV